MTAGRLFWISPPIDGSKLTHQTSPRFIRNVSKGGFHPLMSLALTGFVRRHLSIGVGQVLGNDVRTNQAFDELADLLSANHAMKALIDIFVHGHCKLLVH